MLKKVRKTIDSYRMLENVDVLVVAVSGGSDSVGLLDILAGIEDYALELIVAHVNHGLRTEEAQRDENYVRQLAESYKLGFECRRVDTREYSREKKLSLEEAARELRYQFFDELMEKYGASKIATAHTINDQAETVLLRLVRGTGTAGLSAIPASTDKVIRPLLFTERDEIRQYLRFRKISWFEDSSNYLDIFLRNRVRQEIIPLLKDINPRINTALSNLSLISTAETDYIDSIAKMVASDISLELPFGLVGNTVKYRNEHKAVRMAMLRCFISRIKGDLKGITFSHILSSDNLLISEKASGKVTLSHDLLIARGYDYFCLAHKDNLSSGFSYNIDEPGEWNLSSELQIKIEKVDYMDKSKMNDENTGYFSSEKIEFPIQITNFSEGDRFVPLGMKEQKKLKNLFVDCKIPRFFRKKIPIFKSAGEIFWVGGIRIDERFRVRDTDREMIKISLVRPRFSYRDSFQFL